MKVLRDHILYHSSLFLTHVFSSPNKTKQNKQTTTTTKQQKNPLFWFFFFFLPFFLWSDLKFSCQLMSNLGSLPCANDLSNSHLWPTVYIDWPKITLALSHIHTVLFTATLLRTQRCLKWKSSPQACRVLLGSLKVFINPQHFRKKMVNASIELELVSYENTKPGEHEMFYNPRSL